MNDARDIEQSTEQEINRLKTEISELKKTILSLSQTVSYLTERLVYDRVVPPVSMQMDYSVTPTLRNCIDYDESWKRLLGIVEEAELGLTAGELARKWGKSRSRTSEVLNTLVGQGYLVKYRDGREIKFRIPKE